MIRSEEYDARLLLGRLANDMIAYAEPCEQKYRALEQRAGFNPNQRPKENPQLKNPNALPTRTPPVPAGPVFGPPSPQDFNARIRRINQHAPKGTKPKDLEIDRDHQLPRWYVNAAKKRGLSDDAIRDISIGVAKDVGVNTAIAVATGGVVGGTARVAAPVVRPLAQPILKRAAQTASNIRIQRLTPEQARVLNKFKKRTDTKGAAENIYVGRPNEKIPIYDRNGNLIPHNKGNRRYVIDAPSDRVSDGIQRTNRFVDKDGRKIGYSTEKIDKNGVTVKIKYKLKGESTEDIPINFPEGQKPAWPPPNIDIPTKQLQLDWETGPTVLLKRR